LKKLLVVDSLLKKNVLKIKNRFHAQKLR